MPPNQNKVFHFISKYINELNTKIYPLNVYMKSADIKRLNNLFFLKNYFSILHDNTKFVHSFGPYVQKTAASLLELPKFVEDLRKSFSPRKQPKIPKRKTQFRSVTLESINVQTKHLLHSLRETGLASSRLKRLEDLMDYLLKHSEASTFAVKSGGIGILLHSRISTQDKASQDIICKILAILGYVDPPKSSGVRILSIDGGGMRGLAVLQMLEKIEELSGHKIFELFDFVCGVSTGAIISCGLVPPHQMPMSQIKELYLEMSSKLFNQNAFWGTSKVLWSHAYYDTNLWEKMLLDYIGKIDLVDTNILYNCPKIAMVSSLVSSQKKPSPFVFRNYGDPCYKKSDYRGSFRHTMFEAVRASAAAPALFEGFKTGDFFHQDGGILVNNPAAIALHEARCLWPDESINCIVSVGTGKYDPYCYKKIDSSVLSPSWKQILEQIVESATDTEGIHRTLMDLMPTGSYFRLNPQLSLSVSVDESNLDKLHKLLEESDLYFARNEDKFHEIIKKVTKPRPYSRKLKDFGIMQLKCYGFML